MGGTTDNYLKKSKILQLNGILGNIDITSLDKYNDNDFVIEDDVDILKPLIYKVETAGDINIVYTKYVFEKIYLHKQNGFYTNEFINLLDTNITPSYKTYVSYYLEPGTHLILIKFKPDIIDLSNCFYICKNLIQIPENLFDNLNINSFYRCFCNTGLTSIPQGLFDKNTAVTGFSYCFQNCSNLTGSTPVNSEGKKLWELAGQTGYPTIINGYRCFSGCTKLSDYTDIPTDWK